MSTAVASGGVDCRPLALTLKQLASTMHGRVSSEEAAQVGADGDNEERRALTEFERTKDLLQTGVDAFSESPSFANLDLVLEPTRQSWGAWTILLPFLERRFPRFLPSPPRAGSTLASGDSRSLSTASGFEGDSEKSINGVRDAGLDAAALEHAPRVARFMAVSNTVLAALYEYIRATGIYTGENFRSMARYAEDRLGLANAKMREKIALAGKVFWRLFPTEGIRLLRKLAAGRALSEITLRGVPNASSLALLPRVISNNPTSSATAIVARINSGELKVKELERMARAPSAAPATPSESKSPTRIGQTRSPRGSSLMKSGAPVDDVASPAHDPVDAVIVLLDAAELEVRRISSMDLHALDFGRVEIRLEELSLTVRGLKAC